MKAIEPFSPEAEGVMASLASRTDSWVAWELTEKRFFLDSESFPQHPYSHKLYLNLYTQDSDAQLRKVFVKADLSYLSPSQFVQDALFQSGVVISREESDFKTWMQSQEFAFDKSQIPLNTEFEDIRIKNSKGFFVHYLRVKER